MNEEYFKKSLSMLISVISEIKDEHQGKPARRFESYNYYKTRSIYPGNKKERLSLIFGLSVIFMLFTSFIALVFITVIN